MKIQNMIRIYAVVMGVAGTLLLAGSVAAQEITNTEWPDSSSVSAPAQTTPTADDLTIAPASTSAPNGTAKVGKPVVSQETAVSELSAGEGWVLTSLLAFVAAFSLYAWATFRRAGRNSASGVRQADDGVALS